MGRHSSYWLYQKYEKRGDQDWIPSYPNTYSISGDSENPMPLVVRIEHDRECGWVCDEIERWVEIPITEDYECDDCEVGYQYRWVQCNPSAYTYYGDYKYDILCEEISEDNGQTWSATTYTKVSSASTGVADKKVKITFDNGDTFAISCGSDNGVWESFVTNGEAYWAQDVPNHSTNLYHNEIENYFVGDGSIVGVPAGGLTYHGTNQMVIDYYQIDNPLKNVEKLEFSDCVFEIGDRYRFSSRYNTDIAESGQALSGVNHTFYCNNGRANTINGSDHVIGSGWGIRELVLPPNLKWIGAGVFADNKIRTLTLPSTVESIGYVRGWEKNGTDATKYMWESGAFYHNSRLHEVNLNEGLESIGREDFGKCTALETIEIPSTVTRMGLDVFRGCSSLKQIVFKSETPPEIMCEEHPKYMDCGARFSANSDTYVYVPCGSKSAYTEWISDLPDEKIVEYGGSCPSIPSIDDIYRTIATYKVGNNAYNVHQGLSSSTMSYVATTSTFDNWNEVYGDADEIIIRDYLHPDTTVSRTYHTEINGTKKLTFVGNYGTVGVSTDAEEILISNSETYQISFGYYNDNDGTPTIIDGGLNIKDVTISSGCSPILYASFNKCPNLTGVTINGCASLYYCTFTGCTNLEDVYINCDSGVLPVQTGRNHDYEQPFYGSNPNLKIHVPCELYLLYLEDPFWSGMTIVRDSTDCTPIDPSYDDQLFEITKQEWNYQGSGTTSWYSSGDRVDGYYESYQSRVKDSEIIFNVINKAIRLEFDNYYTSYKPKVYKDGVEVTFTSTGSYPATYEYKNDMRWEYGVTHTFRIVRTANTYSDASPAIDNLKIMYQAG